MELEDEDDAKVRIENRWEDEMLGQIFELF